MSTIKPKQPTIFSKVFWFLRGTYFLILHLIQFVLIRFTLMLFIHPFFICLVVGLMGLIWWVFFLWWIFWKLPDLNDKYFNGDLWDEPKYLNLTIPGFLVFYIVYILFVFISDYIRGYF